MPRYIPDVRAPGAHFPGEPRRRARHAGLLWESYARSMHPGQISQAEMVADRTAPRGTAIWYGTALALRPV